LYGNPNDPGDYPKLEDAINDQDIVLVNLAGNLEAMTRNIVKAMQETGVQRITFLSFLCRIIFFLQTSGILYKAAILGCCIDCKSLKAGHKD
jgi:hypothetical protein